MLTNARDLSTASVLPSAAAVQLRMSAYISFFLGCSATFVQVEEKGGVVVARKAASSGFAPRPCQPLNVAANARTSLAIEKWTRKVMRGHRSNSMTVEPMFQSGPGCG
jgi:hypothetical protein